MTTFFYNLIIRLYFSAIKIVSPFNQKAKLWLEGRLNWEIKLSEKITPSEKWIWFHCSSLGEYEDCCEIFYKIQKSNKTKKSILTVFSPSAYEFLKDSKLFDVITYLPIDSTINAKKFLSIVNPELVLFSRSELWFHYIIETNIRGIPIFLISLKINEKSNFLKWPFKLIYKKCFYSFTYVFCQDNETLDLLKRKFNVNSAIVSGNTRFERIINQANNLNEHDEILSFAEDNKVIIMGSCLEKDEKIFLQIYFKMRHLGIKWIIVPHEIEKSTVSSNIDNKNLIYHSKIDELTNSHDVLFVDSVGILKYLYKYADLAIIGGGFNRIGIHNIVEPSVFGVQTAFGPNHKNYHEAIQLIKIGGASIFKNAEELEQLILAKLFAPKDDDLELRIKKFVKDNSTNSNQIAELINSKKYFIS